MFLTVSFSYEAFQNTSNLAWVFTERVNNLQVQYYEFV